jgi:Cu2+-exporting ATPase
MACAHCSLPVPPSRILSSATEQFCCAGCEAVWKILHECRLEDYYRLRDTIGDSKGVPAHISGKQYGYLDDPDYLAKFGEPRSAGGVRVQFYLEGVHCIACSWLVEKVLLDIEGATFARLDSGKATLEIIFNPAQTRLSHLAQALDRIGYTPHPFALQTAALAQRKETRKLLARIGIAGASAMNIMLLAISQYAGDVSGIEAGFSTLFRWVSLGLCLPAVLYSAWPYYRGAWSGLRRGMMHMDLPISLGIVATFLISAIATVQDHGEVYFDSVSALIFLLLSGRLLLQRASRRAADAGEHLLSLAPRTVHRLQDGAVQDVLLADLQPGDRIQVLPGETVPVDGTLESSDAWISEAHLTGEPALIARQKGDTVYAGSAVGASPLELLTTAVGETTRVARLAEMMRAASARRAPIVHYMDRIAGYFVAGIFIFAALTALIWWQIDPSRILWNVAALLVVACPCALGLATPVALAVAMGRAARKGIFIKGQDGVERLASVSHVILDKTGTLTEGRMAMAGMTYADELSEAEKQTLLAATAAIENLSGHVMAGAFRMVDASHVIFDTCDVTPGAGVCGESGGVLYRVGSAQYLQSHGVALPRKLQQALQAAIDAGHSVVCVARQEQAVAVFALGDRLREDAAQAMTLFAHLGTSVELLSGDHFQAVKNTAAELHIDEYRGGATPEQKLERVEELLQQGVRVAMAGDGVNDASALSRATVGISAAGAAEVARDAADVFISVSRGPTAIAEALQWSRHAMKIIKINLLIALFYNVLGVSLAMAGLVSPLVAAILMPISSLTVLLIAARA